MKLEYPYGIEVTSDFGKIPLIKIALPVYSPLGFINFTFLFDTGADVSSLPASAAGKLGIDLDKCHQAPMSGYEGTKIFVYKSEIKISFNNKPFIIPCVFHPNEEVSILLGRAGILDRFTIIMDGKRKIITFEEL